MAMLCLSAVSLVSAVHEQWPVAGGIVVASGVKEVPPSGETSVRVLVRFDDGVFSLKPHVAVTSLTFADGSPAGITEDQLSVQPDYFTVGFIDTKAWTRPFNFTWTATLQAVACTSHDQCPHAQYCDEIGGCDQCSVCAALSGTDSFDGSCPEKCAAGDNLARQVVCADETYPCGDGCLRVVGNQLPQCTLPPGNAVSPGYGDYPGSLSAYPEGAAGLGLSPDTIRSLKADLAYEKAETVDPHYASPALAVRVLEVKSKALCYTVTCEEEDQCNDPAVCYNGLCSARPPKSNGKPCDDGQVATDDDKCVDGVCVGTDYCDGVTCVAKSECHEAGVCFRGECSDPVSENGKSCSDGLERTDDDKCVDGVCVGIDYCDGVTCMPKSQCHEAGVCFRGECTDPVTENGEPCSDGLERTDDDKCVDGVCVGTDYCAGVTCVAQSQCHATGVCAHGVCSTPLLEAGTKCDDGNPLTSFDQCDDTGACRGIVQPTVGPNQDPDQYETTTTITVPGGGSYKQDRNITDALAEDIAGQLPGVDTGDVDVAWVNDTTIVISVGTRPTNGDERQRELDDVLQNGTFSNVEDIVPGFEFEQDRPAESILNCLTAEECPALNCAAGEVAYKSPYLSVQKCCAECILADEVFEREVRDYQQATEHWRRAQEEQDREYREGEYAEYLAAMEQYESEVDGYAREAAAWGTAYRSYKTKEDTLFRITCDA